MAQLELSEREWRDKLTHEQFRVLRESGTEMPFTGAYWDCHDPGVYQCAGCGQTLFHADTKFDSGTGWPSFWASIDERHLELETDVRFGMRRTEVRCAGCGSHLGHLFGDGPAPTGMRYCINSAALRLERAGAHAESRPVAGS